MLYTSGQRDAIEICLAVDMTTGHHEHRAILDRLLDHVYLDNRDISPTVVASTLALDGIHTRHAVWPKGTKPDWLYRWCADSHCVLLWMKADTETDPRQWWMLGSGETGQIIGMRWSQRGVDVIPESMLLSRWTGHAIVFLDREAVDSSARISLPQPSDN